MSILKYVTIVMMLIAMVGNVLGQGIEEWNKTVDKDIEIQSVISTYDN